MKLLASALLVTGLLFNLSALSAPPQATYVVTVSPTTQRGPGNFSMASLNEVNTAHTMTPIFWNIIPTDNLSNIRLIGAGTRQTPTVIAINDQRELFVLSDKLLPNSPHQSIKALALAEESSDSVLVATDNNNEIVSIDEAGQTHVIGKAGWLDAPTYGQIQHMQLIAPSSLIVVTDKDWLVISDILHTSGGINPVRSMQFTTMLFNHLDPSAPKNATLKQVKGMVATSKAVWLYGFASGINPAAGKDVALLIDLSKSGIPTDFSNIANLIQGDVELLDVDPNTNDLVVRENHHYATYSASTGARTVEQFDIFSPLKIATPPTSPPVPGFAKTLVDHSRSSNVWIMRAKKFGISSSSQAPTVQGKTKITAKPSGKILDPVSFDEFKLFIQKQLPAMKFPASIQYFADWVNHSSSLKYFFKGLKEDEWKQLKLQKWGTESVRPIPQFANEAIDRFYADLVAKILSDVRQRETCEKSLL